ncbi:hypothetical protein ACLOJK_035003 [Asimina triloba]
MCRSKSRAAATEPSIVSISRHTNPPSTSASSAATTSHSGASASDSLRPTASSATATATATSTSSASSSHSSLATLRSSLPPNAHIYSFSEIASATNNFLSKPISSSSSAWRCSLRSKPSVVVHRKLRRRLDHAGLRRLLSVICRSHHTSVVGLLGASVSGDSIYLVYDYVPGAHLGDCLRNPKNPSFTVLSSWLSRMQVAADIAQGLEYIHHYSPSSLHLVHNHIKPSSIIISDPSLNAKICHFGASLLTGEIPGPDDPDAPSPSSSSFSSSSRLERSDSRVSRVEGVRGYMCPEFLTGGIVTQKSDVYAFGVTLLELMSGEEAFKYRYVQERGDYERISVVETAAKAAEGMLLRRWMDRRMKDSYPEDVAEKMVQLALECVNMEAAKRPDMTRVAGKVSKLFIQSPAPSLLRLHGPSLTNFGNIEHAIQAGSTFVPLEDSYPEDVAEKMVQLALECVNVEAAKRPDMTRVAGKVSKLFLQSPAPSLLRLHGPSLTNFGNIEQAIQAGSTFLPLEV